jgi:hypothetical protein
VLVAGVPASVAVPFPLSVKLIPLGSVPVAWRAGVGTPVEVTVNVSPLPIVKVVPSALVICGAPVPCPSAAEPKQSNVKTRTDRTLANNQAALNTDDLIKEDMLCVLNAAPSTAERFLYAFLSETFADSDLSGHCMLNIARFLPGVFD